MRKIKQALDEVHRIAKRIQDNPDIYKIDPRSGTVRMDTSNPKAAKAIADAADEFFKKVHAARQ